MVVARLHQPARRSLSEGVGLSGSGLSQQEGVDGSGTLPDRCRLPREGCYFFPFLFFFDFFAILITPLYWSKGVLMSTTR
jgi:hypothetical protein